MPSISLKFTTTGEKRSPVKGEWYIDDGWPCLRTYENTYKGIEYKILRLVAQKRKGIPLKDDVITIERAEVERKYFNPPIAAFEFTGEHRLPKKNEWFIAGENSPPELAEVDYKKNCHRILRRLTKSEAKSLVFTRRNDQKGRGVA